MLVTSSTNVCFVRKTDFTNIQACFLFKSMHVRLQQKGKNMGSCIAGVVVVVVCR